MIILDSARKHGISDSDMIDVIDEPDVAVMIREEPLKTLFIGFDTRARALEVITDTGVDGQVYVIHADKLTKQYEVLLKEALE